MICSNCNHEFDGNFCPMCGGSAPQEVLCENCNTHFVGNFCPNCGAEYIGTIEARCQRIYDKRGNWIDPARLVGAYPFNVGLRSYFRDCTNYQKNEIEEFISCLRKNVQGAQYGLGYISESLKLRNESSKLGSGWVSEIGKKEAARNERIQQNKQNAVAGCPKCGSTSLSANAKGFGIGKAVVGASLFGGLGLMAGNMGAKKLFVTCLNCGNRWKR